MREILYRAKAANRNPDLYYRTDYKNGDWVYGLVTDTENYAGFAEMINTGRISGIEVDKNTIGQYTGVCDKNGNKIFEGDIVEFYFFDKGHKNTKTMQIKWRDCGFCMKELFRNYRLADDFSIIDEIIFTYRGETKNGVYKTNYAYYVKIVGNIHDNPELLKGENDA